MFLRLHFSHCRLIDLSERDPASARSCGRATYLFKFR